MGVASSVLLSEMEGWASYKWGLAGGKWLQLKHFRWVARVGWQGALRVPCKIVR